MRVSNVKWHFSRVNKYFRSVKCHFRLLNCLFMAMLLLTACSSEDDVIDIFTGKTWKLVRLTNEGSKAQFYQGIWQNDDAMMESIELLYDQPATFTITFEGANIDGELTGTSARGRGVTSSFSGSWTADPKAQTINFNFRVDGAESDPLAKAFIAGLRNVFKYEGGSNTLTLYYKEGERTRLIGLTPQE